MTEWLEHHSINNHIRLSEFLAKEIIELREVFDEKHMPAIINSMIRAACKEVRKTFPFDYVDERAVEMLICLYLRAEIAGFERGKSNSISKN